MPLTFDHAVINVHDLDRAMQDYRELGFTVTQRGTTLNDGAESALIAFADGTALELLAGSGDEGLVGFVLRADDLDAEVARLLAEGFVLSEITPVDYRLENGTLTQRRVVRVDHHVSILLTEDVTPPGQRIRTDDESTTHKNGAVGLYIIDISVRNLDEALDFYLRLLNFPHHTSKHRFLEDHKLFVHEAHESNTWADHLLKELIFGGRVSSAEIDAVDLDAEPESFKFELENAKDNQAWIQRQIEHDNAWRKAVEHHHEALFRLHLIRDQAPDDRFTPDRTHKVQFIEVTGVKQDHGNDILLGLDQIAWNTLHHAYGPAKDVPGLLRALTSGVEAVYQNAHATLMGNIVHQGSVYEASVESIPFLLQILNATDVTGKYYVVDLLGWIIGAALYEPTLESRTRTLLQNAIPIYLAQLHHPDPEVRRVVLGDLELFRETTALIEPALRDLIFAEPIPFLRAKALQTLTSLWIITGYNSPDRPLTEQQSTYLMGLMRDEGQSIDVRFEAGCALLRADSSRWIEDVMPLLDDMMKLPAEILNPFWEESSIHYQLVKLFEYIPEYLVSWINKQAQHPNPYIRKFIPKFIESLIETGYPIDPMISSLRGLLVDPNPDVRESSLSAVHRESTAALFMDLIQDMSQNDPSLTLRVKAGYPPINS